VDAVLDLFKNMGCTCLTEAQFGEKYVDIFCYDDRNKRFFAVEAKVDSPTRAFNQAMKYKFIANSVYVATLKNSSNRKAIQLSEDKGIGLIFVERVNSNQCNAEIYKESRISDWFEPSLANHVLEMNSV
jgi:hypothetical protein